MAISAGNKNIIFQNIYHPTSSSYSGFRAEFQTLLKHNLSALRINYLRFSFSNGYRLQSDCSV